MHIYTIREGFKQSEMVIPFSTRISIPPDVLVSALAGESVLLNLKSEKYFGLDEVGTRMWGVLTSSGSIQEAYETLLAEYDVEAELLRKDLTDLIEKLVEQGLIEVHHE
ncbi:MAG TPA: PqqD family protein [Candidatus Saccharimonadales bacterium]|nr:PqqD family protein [Candidatus Saccharimonadales bacterium]